MKTATLEVVSTKDTKLKQLTTLKEKVEKKIEDKTAELEKKLYIIEGGAKTGKEIVAFLENDAQWKFTEAMGVIEAVKEVKKGIDSVSKKKAKELMFNPLVIEATYYFLTKVEGKGITEATHYFENLLKPVSDALSRSKSDRQQLEQMQRDLATLENAIDNGANVEDSMVKEITAELENDTYGK